MILNRKIKLFGIFLLLATMNINTVTLSQSNNSNKESMSRNIIQILKNNNFDKSLGPILSQRTIENLDSTLQSKALKQYTKFKDILRSLRILQRRIWADDLKHAEKLTILQQLYKLRNSLTLGKKIGYGNLVLMNALAHAQSALIFNIIGAAEYQDKNTIEQLKLYIYEPGIPNVSAIRQAAILELRYSTDKVKESPMALYDSIASLDKHFHKSRAKSKKTLMVDIYTQLLFKGYIKTKKYKEQLLNCSPLLFVHSIISAKQYDCLNKIAVVIYANREVLAEKKIAKIVEMMLSKLDDTEKIIVLREKKKRVDILRKLIEFKLNVKQALDDKGREISISLGKLL